MGKGVDWKSPEAFTRLLAAVVAAQDLKLDYRKIASMYGQGATYDSIEGRFRIIRREAAVLKDEIENGKRPEAPPRGGASNKSSDPFASTEATSFAESFGSKTSTPRKPRTPKKSGIKQEPGNRVLKGRMGKNTTTTTTPQQKKSSKVKEEVFDEEDENPGMEFETQKDVEPEPEPEPDASFMEAFRQVDFEDALQHQGDDALQYQVTMGI